MDFMNVGGSGIDTFGGEASTASRVTGIAIGRLREAQEPTQIRIRRLQKETRA